MISTIARAYDVASESSPTEPYAAWLRAWRALRDDWSAGLRPQPAQLNDYLIGLPDRDRLPAACDLVGQHLRLAWQEGPGPRLDAYSSVLSAPATLPKWLDHVPADVVEEEFLARFAQPHGDAPAVAEYAQRFPNRPDVMQRLRRRCLAGERYIKLRVRGCGGSGIVYEAFDRQRRCAVALKETGTSEIDSSAAAQDRQRLLDEARLTAALQHPGIVSVLDGGIDGTSAYYSMRLVTGSSLHDRIQEYHALRRQMSRRERRRRLEQLLKWLIQVADAVGEAHAHGILHRDLKPGNVLVDEAGEAILIDWGLARSTRGTCTPSRMPALVAGTPQYMAPEQIQGAEDERSDIYSLGAVLYEVLTGRPPASGTAGALSAQESARTREEKLVPPRELCPDTPRELVAICMRALAPRPTDRPRTASEFAAEVQQYAESAEETYGWLTRFLLQPVTEYLGL